MWNCPKCGSDNLSVEVTVRARLIQYPENYDTEIDGSCHEWDGASRMTCDNCGHHSRASDFYSVEACTLAREMTERGFGVQDTGGGCQAYICDDGVVSAWVTDAAASGLPANKGEPMIFGVYVRTRSGQEEALRIEGDWAAISAHATDFSLAYTSSRLTQADIHRPEVAFSVAYEAYKSARGCWTESPACEYLIESTDIFEALSKHGLPCSEENEAKIEDALTEYHFYTLAAEASEASQGKSGKS